MLREVTSSCTAVCNPKTGPITKLNYDFVSRSYGRQFADLYEKYGVGAWHFKPCRSMSVDCRRVASPLHSVRPNCPHMSTGWNSFEGFIPIWTGSGLQSWSPAGVIMTPWSFATAGTDFSSLELTLEQLAKPEHWNRLSQQLNNKLPSIKPDTNYFVSIVEALLGGIDAVKIKRMKTVLDKVAGGLLQWSFAVRPLISDIKGIEGTIYNLLHQWRILQLGAEKRRAVKTSVLVPIEYVTETLTNVCPWPPYWTSARCANPEHRILKYERITYDRIGVTMKYKYHFPKYASEVIGDVMGALGALGLVPSWDDLWELVPFSFVVDWVFNTDRILDRWRGLVDPHDVEIELVDICTTIAVEVEERWAVSGLQCLQSGDFSICKYKMFQRQVGSDSLSSRLPWVMLPTSWQMALGAALAWSIGLIPRLKRT